LSPRYVAFRTEDQRRSRSIAPRRKYGERSFDITERWQPLIGTGPGDRAAGSHRRHSVLGIARTAVTAAAVLALAAGKGRAARRRIIAALVATAALAGLVVLAVAALTGTFTKSTAPVTGTVRPSRGPSAEQLAHGRWVSMPAAPFRLCVPISVWDGRDLVVIEPGVRANGWCPARAATYDPRANSWTAIGAPPDTIGEQVGAWGGGRLVLVAKGNGKTISWSPADGHWRQLGRTPYGGIPSVTWTGRGFLVIVTRGRHSRAFMLNANRWARLPDLPQPGTGSIVESAAAVSHGTVYVLADVAQVAPPWGDVELFRLTAAGWTRTPMSAGAPSSNFTLTTVAGGIVAAGSACLGKGGCTVDLEALAILRPGANPDVVPLDSRPGVPAPTSIAAGADAVVVTNPGVAAAATPWPPTRKCLIYDLATGAWHRGPTTPNSQGGLGTYWTPYGVISLGQFGARGIQSDRVGGWLLRPPSDGPTAA
jgi:hypothetical protein